MMENNLLTNLCTYEHLHLDQPWWNSSADTFRIDNRLYFAASDYSLMGQGLTGLIYNRDLFRQEGLDKLYDIDQLVWDKEWTISLLREIAMKYGKDTDGDIATLGGTYGMIFQSYHTNAYYWSMGGTVVSKGQNDEYFLSIDADYAQNMGNALCELVYNSEKKVYTMPRVSWKHFEKSEGWKYYKQGTTMFISVELGALGVLANSIHSVPFDIGFAPLPMLSDTNQNDYYSLRGNGFFMIPKKAINSVRSSVLLEALSIESYAKIRPNLIKYTLWGREGNPEYEKDSAMLELIHGSVTYDLGYTWSHGGSSSILQMVVDDGDTAIKSLISGRWREMSETLDYIANIRNGQYD